MNKAEIALEAVWHPIADLGPSVLGSFDEAALTRGPLFPVVVTNVTFG